MKDYFDDMDVDKTVQKTGALLWILAILVLVMTGVVIWGVFAYGTHFF